MNRLWRRVCIGALAAIGVWQLTAGLYIHAKAWLAQQLIAHSWERTLAGEREVRPWPWADTWPIARLRVPDDEIDIFILADASGRSLAFGPGFLSGSAWPGTAGNTIIAAHRDTHFRFLRDASIGTDVVLQTHDGLEYRYRIVATHVIDVRTDQLEIELDQPTLSLVTCYPFDAVIPGGPLRFVAVAEATDARLIR